MKHSARVMSLLMTLSGAVVPAAPAQNHLRRPRPKKLPPLKLAVRQRVPQSEPMGGKRPRARSSEQAIAVAREENGAKEKWTDIKGTGGRAYSTISPLM